MIPNLRFLAPDGFPCLVKGVERGSGQGESLVEVIPANQFETQAGGQDDGGSGAVQRICRHAVHDGEFEFQLGVRAAEGKCVGGHFGRFRGTGACQQEESRQEEGAESVHISVCFVSSGRRSGIPDGRSG